MQKDDRSRLESLLEERFQELFRTNRRRTPPPVRVRFHRYSRLAHNIRLQDGRVDVRLSDILIGAPSEVLDAILSILIAKLYRQRPRKPHRERYLRYINRPEVRAQTRKIRRERGRLRMLPPKGEVFDLAPLFEKLNHRHFEGRVEVSRLGWSSQKRKRILGHYDAAHGAIVIDRSLDNPLIPSYVVEYVLFHEMLHVVMGEEIRDGVRYVHHRSFKEAERAFPDFKKAKRFIRENFPSRTVE